MKTFAFVVLQTIRFLLLLIALWQVLGLLPVFSWFGNLDNVTGGMWGMVAIKGFVLAVCLGLFFGFQRLAKRLRGDCGDKENVEESLQDIQ